MQDRRRCPAEGNLRTGATRGRAYMVYAWCRHCDDQTDDQELGFDGSQLSPEEGRARVDQLRAETERALSGELTDDPICAGLQRVVTDCDMPHRYPMEHLDGFVMDVEGREYRTLDNTVEYCYHVAGVVGVMMAYIMGVRDEPTLDRATDLGLAFQIADDLLDPSEQGRALCDRSAAALPADGPTSALMAEIVGVLSGMFTPTESSGIAVVYTILVAILVYRSLSWEGFKAATTAAVRTTAMVMMVMGIFVMKKMIAIKV